MRTIIILLFLGLFSLGNIPPRAPERDAGVECQLSLIQAVPNQQFKGLALSLSIVNHSDQDLYIPCFTLGIGNVHLYERDGDSLKELDLLNQDSKGGLYIRHPLDLSRNFEQDEKEIRYLQDSVLNLYCTMNNLPFKLWKVPGRNPLFLKAHQEIKYLNVYDMDFLLTPGKQYVFSFKAQAVKTTYAPANILGYTRFDQDQIKANTLFYQTVNP